MTFDPSMPRPVRHLVQLGRDYEGLWNDYARFLQGKGAELDDWPHWCFCPMAGAYAVISGMGQDMNSIGNDIARMTALAAWRPTQGIYRFDDDVREALMETPNGKIPVDALYRLPEWCVYVETPGYLFDKMNMHGFFAHLEYDVNDHRHELRFLLDVDEMLVALPIHIWPGVTIEEGWASGVREIGRVALTRGENSMGLQARLAEFGRCSQKVEESLGPLLSLLLYLCADENEIVDYKTGKARDEQAKMPAMKKTKRGVIMPPAKRPVVWETAFQLGRKIREGRENASAGGEGGRLVRPHIRRAHWHSFWTGPRSEPGKRKLSLKWLAPIAVHADREVEPTVRLVK